MERRPAVEGVVRALRRVNVQGSIFGQSVAIRLGLSESDIDALELLIDGGAATAGRLSDLLGLTTGAVTRVVDRLEQAGYVRRSTDPADRRRVVIEVVPERLGSMTALLASMEKAAADEMGRYSPAELAVIGDFLARMADVTQAEASRLRTVPEDDPGEPAAPSEHAAPIGGLTAARLTFRSGAQDLRLRPSRSATDLYRARFDGATPQVRIRDGRVLVQYRGMPFDWRKRIATIALNTSIPWTIEIVGGVNRVEADLREVPVHGFELTGGSDRVQLELGRPTGEVPLRIIGGTRAVRLERPTGVPVRVRVVGSSGGVTIDEHVLGRKGGEATVDSRGWAAAADRYALEVIGGSKSIEVIERRG